MNPDSNSCGDACSGNSTGGRQETLLSLNRIQEENPFDEFRAFVLEVAASVRPHEKTLLSSTVGPRSGKKMGEWGTETTRQTSIREWR